MTRRSALQFASFVLPLGFASALCAAETETPESLLKRIAALEKRVKELEEKLKAAEKPSTAVTVQYKPTEIDKEVAKKLDEVIPMRFEGNRLVNVLDYFQNTTGVDFFIDWGNLEIVGIEEDQRVTFSLEGKPASTGLKLTLHQASGGDKATVTYAILEGVVVVSTKRGLALLMEEKVKFKDAAAKQRE